MSYQLRQAILTDIDIMQPPILSSRFLMNLRRLGSTGDSYRSTRPTEVVSTITFVTPSTFLGNIGEDLDYDQHDGEGACGIDEDGDVEGISEANQTADSWEDYCLL